MFEEIDKTKVVEMIPAMSSKELTSNGIPERIYLSPLFYDEKENEYYLQDTWWELDEDEKPFKESNVIYFRKDIVEKMIAEAVNKTLNQK